jgi:hypothetical protein
MMVIALVATGWWVGCVPVQEPESSHSQSPISDESKQTARQADEYVVAAQKQMDEQIDKNQAELEKAMKAALGQEASYPGAPLPLPASQAIKEIREAKIELQIAPVLDAQGKPVADQFVHVEDSYSRRVVEIGPKMASKKATQAEIKFLQEGAQHVPKLNDLQAQVRTASMPAMNAGWMITTGSMTTMSTVANMIRTRRQMEMEWIDEDYELVRQIMERQSRREAVGALSLAMMGAYQAVLNQGADPSLIDEVAKAGLEAMPLAGKAAIEEARTYVDNFESNVEFAQKLYEEQMRKTFGDEQYEAKYKTQLDSMFAQAASATQALSASELIAQNQQKYRKDLETCAKGEALPPDTMVGPDACKRAKASASPDGSLSPEALESLLAGKSQIEERAQGGLMGLLDSIPGVAQVKLALEGVAALKDGDTSKVFRLAADLVPVPGVRSVLETASTTVASVQGNRRKP